MDDVQDLANWIGRVALGLVLAALAWVLVGVRPTSGDHGQVHASGSQISGALTDHGPLDHTQRCVDAAAARQVSGCAATSYALSAPPTPSDRRVQRSTGPRAVAVTPPPAQVSVPPVQPSLPQSNQQPSTQQPRAPTKRSVPHNGPVPGGATAPPHTGPQP
jgi:hypothetical protein